MKLLEILERTENGAVKSNENNTRLIMNYIIENEISNVNYFVYKELGMKASNYKNAVNRIKNKDSDFYNYYEEKLNIYQERVLNNIKTALLYMGTFMNYGIELEDGSFREFDTFDWFIIKNKYFDNLNRPVISKILDEFNKDPIVYQTDIKYYNLRKLISMAYGDSLDNYSEPIHRDWPLMDKHNGLSKEEAIKLVEFMETHNIPFNHFNYQLGVNKMIKQRNNPNDIFKLDISIEDEQKQYVRIRK